MFYKTRTSNLLILYSIYNLDFTQLKKDKRNTMASNTMEITEEKINLTFDLLNKGNHKNLLLLFVSNTIELLYYKHPFIEFSI